MRYLLFIFCTILLLSACKKKKTTVADFTGTHWRLHFKNNPTFSFFAESELFFKDATNVDNYRNFDTLYGTWAVDDDNNLSVKFDNGDLYTGTLITDDSLSGTLKASGNNGVWNARKQ
ncbi:MAG: hypothetical protein U0T77_10270 [Chitinophagales bacterium]